MRASPMLPSFKLNLPALEMLSYCHITTLAQIFSNSNFKFILPRSPPMYMFSGHRRRDSRVIYSFCLFRDWWTWWLVTSFFWLILYLVTSIYKKILDLFDTVWVYSNPPGDPRGSESSATHYLSPISVYNIEVPASWLSSVWSSLRGWWVCRCKFIHSR